MPANMSSIAVESWVQGSTSDLIPVMEMANYISSLYFSVLILKKTLVAA